MENGGAHRDAATNRTGRRKGETPVAAVRLANGGSRRKEAPFVFPLRSTPHPHLDLEPRYLGYQFEWGSAGRLTMQLGRARSAISPCLPKPFGSPLPLCSPVNPTRLLATK
jgi:hypothetical protein